MAAEWSHDGSSQDSAPAAFGAALADGLGSVTGSAPAPGDAAGLGMLDSLLAELTAMPAPAPAGAPASPYPQVVPGSPESGYGGDEQSGSPGAKQLPGLPAFEPGLPEAAVGLGGNDLTGLLGGCHALLDGDGWAAPVLPSAGGGTCSVVPSWPAL